LASRQARVGWVGEMIRVIRACGSTTTTIRRSAYSGRLTISAIGSMKSLR